jgi:hypothetical protein
MKCDHCNKKCLIVVTCSCEKSFCIKHRMPEDHKCGFDFVKKNKDLLTSQMPVINFEKLPNKI